MSDDSNTALPAPIDAGRFFVNRKGDFCVVQLRDYDGMLLFDARRYATGADGMSRPTAKGIAITVRKLPDFAKAVVRALEIARERGLLADEPEPAADPPKAAPRIDFNDDLPW